MEEDDKKMEEGGCRQGRKAAKPSKSGEPLVEVEDESKKAKNHSNCQQRKEQNRKVKQRARK